MKTASCEIKQRNEKSKKIKRRKKWIRVAVDETLKSKQWELRIE